MPYSLGEVRRAFTGKLGFELTEGHRHPIFALHHQGRIVAKTHISHGTRRDISEGVISAMARQLRVTGPQLRGALACTVTGPNFAELVVRRASEDSAG